MKYVTLSLARFGRQVRITVPFPAATLSPVGEDGTGAGGPVGFAQTGADVALSPDVLLALIT